MSINYLLEKIGNEINEHVKKNDNGKQQLKNVVAFVKGGGIIDPIYEYVLNEGSEN